MSHMEVLKKLREATLAPFGDCKKALDESGGDFDAALDWLRKNGAMVGTKKASREANDGVIAADAQQGFGTILEIGCETDFVARSEPFQTFVEQALGMALAKSSACLDSFLQHPFVGDEGGRPVQECVLELAGRIGENIMIRRLTSLQVNPGVVVAYVHQPCAGSFKMGKIGVLVALESQANEEDLKELGKNLAMHVAFANPQCVAANDIDPSLLAKEEAFLKDQIAEQSAKTPAEVQKKMLIGRMKKFRESIALEEQEWVRDSSKRVKDVIQEKALDLNTPIRIAAFAITRLGDGQGA